MKRENKLGLLGVGALVVFYVVVLSTAKDRPARAPRLSAHDLAEVDRAERRDTGATWEASAVAEQYEQNAIHADSYLKDKYFKVRGRIGSIDKDILGDPFVLLETPGVPSLGIQCVFPRNQAAALSGLSKDQEITIFGKCSGRALTLVIFRDCEIVYP